MRTSKECFFLIGVLFIAIVYGHQLSDKRKCADPKCEELISVGKTVNRYDAPAEGLLSYPKDADVKVFSKEAGSNPSLWGVEIRGQRGYANKGFIKETKIFMKDQLLIHEVPTKEIPATEMPERQILTLETDNADDELDDELDDEPDDGEDNSTNDDTNNKEIDGGEIIDESGEDASPETSSENSPPAEIKDDTASQSADNDKPVTESSVFDSHPSGIANDPVPSPPVDISPTPPGFDVVDGTTIYHEDDAPALPQYPPVTETPPPPPLAQMTQTLSPAGASQYFSSDSDSDSSTPNLEVVPSGEASSVLMPSEVVSDSVLSTASDSSASHVTVEPHASNGPPLLSTLSGAVSDDSKVHATTSSVKEQTLGSSQVTASVTTDESSLSTGDAELNDPSKLEDKHIEPSAVEQESVGIFSSIASSFATMFESSNTDENSVEAVPEDDGESVEKSANDKNEVEDKNPIVQPNQVDFVPTPKPQDIVDTVPENPIVKETGEVKENVPLDSSTDDANEAAISPVDSSQEAEQEIPVAHSSDSLEKQKDELNPQEPHTSNNNDIELVRESGENSSGLPPGTDSDSEVAQEAAEKDEMHDVEDSDSSNNEGSDPSNVNDSNPSNDEDSGSSNDEDSGSSNDEDSASSNDEDSASSNDEDSASSNDEDSANSNDEHSANSNVEGSDYESTSTNASDDDGSAAGDNNNNNVDESSDEQKIDLPASDPSPQPSSLHKFITNINGDHSDVKHDKTVAMDPISADNEQDSSYPHPDTTTRAPDQNTEVQLGDAPSDDKSEDPPGGAEVLQGDLSSHAGSGGETQAEEELPSPEEDPVSGKEDHSDHHQHSQTEAQSSSVPDEENQDLSGSKDEGQDGGGLDLHDPDSIAGKLMQVAEPIMMWLSSFSQLGDSLLLAVESEASQPHLSSGTLLSVLLVAFTFIVLMLYSVHALLTKCSREGPLLEALNAMEHEHHVAAAVIMQLQEKLVAATSGSSSGGGETTIVHDSAEVDRLTEQLQLLQEEASNRAARIQELEQELEESTSSGLEMHAMLQDLLHEQRDTAGFQDSVDHLQKMLDSQREKVESLTSDLSIKTTLNDELKLETKSSREKISKLEYQLEQVTHSLEEVSSSKDRVQGQLTEEQSRAQAVTEQLRDLTLTHEQTSAALTDLQAKHTAAEQKTERLQKLLRTKETELHVTKECLKQLKLFNDGKGSKEKLAQMLDVIKVQAQLSSAQQECSGLQQQLQQRAEEAASLQVAAEEAKAEAARCLDLQQKADSERSDALSKLDVLTSYFQEKEAQLTKELESESGLRHNAEGSAETVSSRIRDYDMQLLAYKTQVEGLKKELDDQEQSYRAQVAAQEQKAHESWVAARAAERKLDESKQETSQLRSRLLLATKESADNHAIVKPTPKHPEVSNGSLSSPRPPLHDDLDGEHSLPLNPMDSPPPIPPPHMLPPHLFAPPHGAPPLPPGMPPFPPPPGMHPPGMHPPGMHPPHPFLPPPLPPPMMSDRRLPPAGRLASPSFHRRSPPDYLDRHGAPSPPFDQRRSPAHYDRRSYSPSSEHSRYSDRQGRYSPDRHSERQYADSRHHNDRYHHHNNGGDRHLDRYSPERRRDSSPDRWLNRSPDGYARKPSPPRRLYDDQHRKGKKTSTPLGPNDR